MFRQAQHDRKLFWFFISSSAVIKQCFREMFRQAQHDRKQRVLVKERTFVLVFCRGDRWSPAVVDKQNVFPTHRYSNKEFFHDTPLCHSERWFFTLLCHSERSRGISRKRILSSSPRRGVSFYLGFVPRGLSSAVFLSYSPRRGITFV